MARASKEAAAALRFLPRLIVPEGRLAGRNVKLATYQKIFVRGAFAKGIEAGCLSIGRGNAKTALSAGLALGHLMGEIAPQPKREIIFAARNRDQAKTAFGFLLGFIEGLPEDEQEQFTIRRGSKLEVETDENGGGLARVIAAGGKSILGGAHTVDNLKTVTFVTPPPPGVKNAGRTVCICSGGGCCAAQYYVKCEPETHACQALHWLPVWTVTQDANRNGKAQARSERNACKTLRLYSKTIEMARGPNQTRCNMQQHVQRGIVDVYASSNTQSEVVTVLKELDAKFLEFKAKTAADVKAAQDAADQANAKLAAAEMAGGTTPLSTAKGNLRDETIALAEYTRTGNIRADLSIGGGSAGDLSKGGAATFPAVSDKIMSRQFDQSAMARLARRVTIDAGDRFEEPQDLGQPAANWVDEKEARPNLATADFALLSVTADEIYTSQRITQRLLDDSQYDLGTWLAERIADRLARGAGEAFMIGDGTKKPKGITTYPVDTKPDDTRAWGTVQAIYTGNNSAVTPDQLVDVIYSLRAFYRPGAVWLMNSKTAGMVRKLKDADGRFLWADSIAAGQPPLLLGYPVEIDESAPDVAAGAKAILFGDMAQAYIIVDKPGLRLLRDPFTDKPNQIFYAYARVGGGLQNSDAVKAIVFGAKPAGA